MIVPRWEWRAFGSRFGRAEGALSEAASGPSQESDEVYFVAGTDGSPKIRDGLVDVKVLREVDANGLERWEPVLKRAFPLPADDVTTVFEALGLDPPRPPEGVDTLERLIERVSQQEGTVRIANVHKVRTRSTLMGCMAELADVTVDGRATRTIAIESEDAAAVIAAVRALGLDGYVNTSYPRGLGALIRDEPRRYAAIDVGTNSVKFRVGERSADGARRAIVDRAEITRLGEDLDRHGSITEPALERTVDAIDGMVDEAREQGVAAIVAVGTEGLRAAGNREDVIAAIRSRAGITVEVLSGEEESRLAYLAVEAELDLGDGTLVVFDTGGGSSQFTFGHGGRVDERFSVDVGAVRYTQTFGLAGAVTSQVLRDALASISDDLSRLDDRDPPDALVAMGGAVTNLAAVSHDMATYDPDVVQGTVLHREEIDRQIETYRSRDAEARREIIGLQPKRADVILAGACIVRTVMEKLGQPAITVSDRGLRHGVLLERFGA
ncbi:MAG TPA: Ppx/GppA family phosphatase [Actinomycetota bacterium]